MVSMTDATNKNMKSFAEQLKALHQTKDGKETLKVTMMDKHGNEEYSPSSLLQTKTSLLSNLSQALSSSDSNLLESVLAVADAKTIQNSVRSLSDSLATLLLHELVLRLKESPGRALGTLPWIKVLLLSHREFLQKDPASCEDMKTLLFLMRERTKNYFQLKKLEGKIDYFIYNCGSSLETMQMDSNDNSSAINQEISLDFNQEENEEEEDFSNEEENETDEMDE